MGPQEPKDVTRDIARDLTALVGEIAALKGMRTTGSKNPSTPPSSTAWRTRTPRSRRR
jgi:hypothetical protein